MQQTLPPPGEVVTLLDGRRLMSRPKSGGMGVLEPVYLPPAGMSGDKLEVWGEAHIRNGPGKCYVPGCGCGDLHIVARNKITGQGLRAILNAISVNANTTAAGGTPSVTVAVSSSNTPQTFSAPGDGGGISQANALNSSWIYVGTGSGATSDGTTNLAAAVATKPTSTARSLSGGTSGPYRLSFTATWTAGSITGATVTEIGVYGTLNVNSATGQGTLHSLSNCLNGALFARLSVTDAEFSSFVINTAAPLVIEYRITLTFT